MKVYVLVEDFDNGEDYEEAWSYDGKFVCVCQNLDSAKKAAVDFIADQCKSIYPDHIKEQPTEHLIDDIVHDSDSYNCVYKYGFTFKDEYMARDRFGHCVCCVLEEEVE